MQAKPIIFNGDMVRAILDGRKTQTRRVISLLQGDGWNFEAADGGRFVLGKITSPHPKKGKFGAFMRREIHPGSGKYQHDIVPCPYGHPGDLLYVRETFTKTQHGLPVYKADARDADGKYWSSVALDKDGVLWTPSIHMPRWASRITLEITDVRVERLQNISELDALEEGITYNDIPNNGLDPMRARTWFRGLWSGIYGAESWHVNPWVWVIEFKPHLKNVDDFLKG